jgi:Cys-rich protein (TIGR01571 family)
MKLDFLGRRQAKDKHTFAVMSSIVIMWGMMNLAIFAAFNYKWSQRIELSVADYCALGLINLSVMVFAMFATASTRATLREKLLIREHRCYDLEDCCCGTFCMPCTICQMSRHTVDFKSYEAACCSETGLEEGSDIPLTGSEVSGTNYFCANDSSGQTHFCANKDTKYFCADNSVV